jgi:uncharacterized RDD family membrane protein YckC
MSLAQNWNHFGRRLGLFSCLAGIVCCVSGQVSLDLESERDEEDSRRGADTSRIIQANSFGAIFNPHDELFSIGGGDVTIGANESTRQAVIITGSILVEGEIDRDLVVVAGSAHIDGRVGGSVIVVGGSATFGPTAEVDGDTVLIGGPFEISPDALLRGQKTEFQLGWLLPAVQSVGSLLGSTLLLARPFAPQMTLTWWLAGGLFIVNFLILLLLPRPTRRCVEALTRGPVTAFLIGMAVLLLFGPLLVLLVASGFGILLIPFLLCLGLATVLLGKVSVYSAAGGQIVDQIGFRKEIPILAFVIGSFGFLITYMIPVIGFMAIGLVIPLGVGAVILAGCNAFRGEVVPRGGSDGFTGKAGESGATGMASSGVSSGADSVEDSSSASRVSDLGAENHSDRVGFWPRIAATMIDSVLVGLLFSIFIGASGPGATRLLMFVWIGYHIVMWSLKGATVGGIFLGIRCVTLDGQGLSWGTATIRSLGSIFSFVALLIGFFWASWSRERQSWHDMIAGTTIVRVSKVGWPKQTAQDPIDPVSSSSFSESETKTAS